MKSRWVLLPTAVLCFIVLPSAAVAQVESGVDLGVSSPRQARAATLARLRASRDAFIGEIVERWAPEAKSRGLGELWRTDLTNALSAAKDDRLVAASEASSYEGLVFVLGARAAKSSAAEPTIRLMNVGDDSSDLVYNEVAPCRIFDTRLGDATHGFLPANTPRAYAHNQLLAAQGGNAAGCGIPTDPAAIAITLTVTQPAGPGNIRAWRYLDPVPNASVVNYTNIAGLNLANTTIIPTCQVCGFDFNVQADVSGTHLIGDVVGYFWRPTSCVAGQANLLGECVETGIRGATTVFTASDTCEGLGGRLANGLELRSLRGVLALDATGEWVDAIQSPDGVSFFSMIIGDGGGFERVSTISGHPYRCVFSQFAH
jgi:hypothetical protein